MSTARSLWRLYRAIVNWLTTKLVALRRSRRLFRFSKPVSFKTGNTRQQPASRLLLSGRFGFPRRPRRPLRLNRRRLSSATLVVSAGILAFSIISPSSLVQAERTLTWTSNADFSFNQASQCQPTTANRVVVSGAKYNNDTCSSETADASISLQKAGIDSLKGVEFVSSGNNRSLAVKDDGTVWTWGDGSNGQLGNGTISNTQTRPVQVHNPDGSGFLTDVVAVAAGDSHSLAVKEDGTVWAWGLGSSGQLGDGSTAQQTRPIQVHNSDGSGFLTDVIAVATGNSHSLALKEDGTVWAWGVGNNGRLGNGSTTQQTRPIQVHNPDGSGFLTDVVAVTAGDSHSLAVKEDGTVWAWGVGNNGRLGNGSITQQTRPIQVHNPDGSGFLTDVIAIAAGDRHSLALKEDGTVWAWGLGSSGQLGDGSTAQQTRPVQVHNSDGSGFLTDVVSVSAGIAHSLALKEDGAVWAWGSGSRGQLGNSSTSLTMRPIQVHDPTNTGFLTSVASVAAGTSHSLALKEDGTVWAWGSSTDGRLGNGSASGGAQNRPVQVHNPDGSGFLMNVVSVSAGAGHSLAVKSDGSVWAWGDGANGRLGTGSTTDQTRPSQVNNHDGSGFLTDVIAVATGNSHSLALKEDGTVWAWGYNNSGQLGDGLTTQQTRPVQVHNPDGSGFLTDVIAIAAGGNHSIALKEDGTVWAWGLGSSGQLGDGSTAQQTRPVQVHNPDGSGFLTDVVAVAAGDSHSLAVKEDGTVWAWGSGGSGRLGNGSVTQQTRPVQVHNPDGNGFLNDVMAISAGGGYSMAVKENGTVWAWGLGSSGQLGNSAVTNTQTRPVQVHSSDGSGFLTDVMAISAGGSYSMAVKENGTVWTWGLGSSGQLGNGTVTSTQVRPVQVYDPEEDGVLVDVDSVAAGNIHSLALKQDGTVWGWGSRSDGRLGDGSTTGSPQNIPMRVGSLTNVVSVAAGSGGHSLAIRSDGTVMGWGTNVYGQVGSGVATNRHTTPVSLPITDVVSAATGAHHSIALKEDGTVWAWGRGDYGVLGNGDTARQNLPVQVHNSDGSGFLTDVIAVATVNSHSLALKEDGTVWAWGYGGNGQLGYGSPTQQTRPIQVHNSDGSGFLTDVIAVATGNSHSLALKEDGTVWAWGSGGNGQLGNSAVTNTQTRPVQVHSSDGSGFLTDVMAISAGGSYSMAVKEDGTVWAWGNNSNGALGSGKTPNPYISRPIQTLDSTSEHLDGIVTVSAGSSHTLAVSSDGSTYSWGANTNGILGRNYPPNDDIYYTADYIYSKGGFASSGTLTGLIVDFGPAKRTQWKSLNWNTDALPRTTSVSFEIRTSRDGNSWSEWSDPQIQDATGSISGSASLEYLPMSRMAEIKVTLSSFSRASSPTLHDFFLSFRNDTTAPTDNASELQIARSSTGPALADNAWTNKAYASWQPGADQTGGTGIWGYCVYVGQNADSDLTQTKGILGDSPIDTNGACQYATAETHLDLADPDVLGQELTTSSDPYFVLVKAIDNSGNIYEDEPVSSSFRYDNTPPKNPEFISAPSQFVATKDITLTWPTTGSAAASDQGSGLAGLQYRIGNNGTWYGSQRSGTQDSSDLLANNGTYTTVDPIDYDRLQEGNNIIAFRTFDQAGNISDSSITTVVKINTNAPSTPEDLSVTPASNTDNKFAFSWKKPTSFMGAESALSYCYSANIVPTQHNCSYLEPGVTELPEGAYATQPGENTMYIVARDEAGNINYATAASVEFTANTSAPGVPRNLDVADISVKDSSIWKLTIAWEPPADAGAGVASYRVMRSTDGKQFTQVATTSGTSHIETNLEQRMYHYKVQACDSANNCGVLTEPVKLTPTGKFTSPAELISSPTVEVKNRTARISWTTDRGSDSRIQLGTKSKKYFNAETSRSEQTKNHLVELNNLLPDTTYYYTARWTDEDGNTGSSSELIFRTLPAPTVKDIAVERIQLNSAMVKLTSKDATQVKIYYGISDGFGGVKTINTSAQESNYSVQLDGLADGTKYFYKINTVDSEGYEYDSNRIDSFETPARPQIQNLRFQPVEGEPTSTQQVTWKTNVPTSSFIRYRTDSAPLIEASDSKLKTSHSMIIKGLLDDSTYTLTAQSRDALGNLASSEAQSFKTALDTRPPKLSDLRVETSIRGVGSEARGQLVVSWRTDEPATSRVAYGKGASGDNYQSSTAEDTALTTEHMVVISNLDTSQVYHLQPISKDKGNNTGKGKDRSAIIGQPSDSVLDIILGTLERIFGL